MAKKFVLFENDGNTRYQRYLLSEAIEIDGVVEVLADLMRYVRMAIVTTSKREDFEVIHHGRPIRQRRTPRLSCGKWNRDAKVGGTIARLLSCTDHQRSG